MRALLLAFLVASAARGADVYDAPGPAPTSYAPLLWRANGVESPGYWYSAIQTQRIDARIKYLEDRATKECVAATNAETRKILGGSSTTWIIAGAALLVGIAGGVYAAHHF